MEKESLFGGNVEFKEEYLKVVEREYSDSTFRNTHALLRVAKMYEDLYEKDVYDFTLSEMTEMLTGIRAKTENSLRQKISVYNGYIDYAINKGVSVNTANIMQSIMSEDIDEIVDTEATNQRYTTREELFQNIVYLNNDQDRVIFALLFDGVMGKDYVNLIKLKVNDIDTMERVARLHDGSKVKLSNDTINIILLAINEDTYEGNRVKYKVIPNRYVVRAPKRLSGTEDDPLQPASIRSKIDKFKKALRISGLTGRSIYLSGVAERFIDVFGYDNNLRLIDIEEWLSENNVGTNAQVFKSIIKVIMDKKTA